MADNSTVGGLQPLGDPLGRQPRRDPRDGHPPGGQPARERPAETDSVELSATATAAFDLLEQRVLAATRQRLSTRDHAPGAIVRAAAPVGAAAAVARIQSSQHWLLGGQAADPAQLLSAFVEGLDETEAILGEIAPGDAAVAQWLAAVRARLEA